MSLNYYCYQDDNRWLKNEYDCDIPDFEYREYWKFYYYETLIPLGKIACFNDLKSALNEIFEEKVCLIIAEQEGKRIGASLSDILYTKDMNLRKGRSILAKTIDSLREIKSFIKHHGTIKILYWDATKNFEYQVH